MKFIYIITLLAATGVLHAQIDTRVNPPKPAPATTQATDEATDKTDEAAGDAKGPQQPSEQQPVLSGLEVFQDNARNDQLSFSGQISEFADSHARTTADGAHFGLTSQFGGQVKFEHSWRQSSLTADYSGGISTGDRGSNLGQNYQEVGVTQLLLRGHWRLMAGGHFTYLPESAFGYNVLRSIPDATATLKSTAILTQTVFTRPSVQLHETVVSEADYMVDHLSSISMYGTYTRQSCDSPGLLNSNQVNATFGYNRSLNPRDSIALTYSFGRFNFDNPSDELQTHTIEFFYAHRISANLGLKVSIGPQLRSFQHISGTDPGIPATVVGSAELDYQLRRTYLNVGYLRETTSGSGVLVGSLVDQVSVNADRQLSKLWHASVSMAYAHTSELESFSTGPKQTFNAAYALVSINRRLGPNVETFFSYGLQVQNSPAGASSPGYFNRHMITIGLLFHPRAWVMR